MLEQGSTIDLTPFFSYLFFLNAPDNDMMQGSRRI